MLRDGGTVTVMSVVQAPRDFLEGLATEEWRPFVDDSVVPVTSGRDESEIARYINERGTRLVAPVVAALASRGLAAQTVFVEDDEAADAIVRVAHDIGAHTIVMGATRQLFDESAWSSVSMKVTAASKLPVLLVPAPSKPPQETAEVDEDGFDFTEFTDMGPDTDDAGS
jgi:nucleotide-binding universal stress UspA family protein